MIPNTKITCTLTLKVMVLLEVVAVVLVKIFALVVLSDAKKTI